MIDLIILYAMSVIAFVLIAYDRHLEHFGRKQFSTALLMVPTALFGAFGALCGMIFFKHRGADKTLRLWVPLLAAIEVLLIILWRMFLNPFYYSVI